MGFFSVEEMAGGSDVEREASRVTSLPPARVYLPNESPVTQIASGLHHTGMESIKISIQLLYHYTFNIQK